MIINLYDAIETIVDIDTKGREIPGLFIPKGTRGVVVEIYKIDGQNEYLVDLDSETFTKNQICQLRESEIKKI